MLEIVLVDDSKEDLIFFQRVLRECHLLNTVRLFQTGEECISFFQAEHLKPIGSSTRCLVFLDLIMAPVGGIEMLSRLKNAGWGKDSVFIMLSGITDIKALNQGYQLGARTFLIKPTKADDVLQTLHAMRTQIKVRQLPGGYLLDWIEGSAGPEVSLELDTSFLLRAAGLPEKNG